MDLSFHSVYSPGFALSLASLWALKSRFWDNSMICNKKSICVISTDSRSKPRRSESWKGMTTSLSHSAAMLT